MKLALLYIGVFIGGLVLFTSGFYFLDIGAYPEERIIEEEVEQVSGEESEVYEELAGNTEYAYQPYVVGEAKTINSECLSGIEYYREWTTLPADSSRASGCKIELFTYDHNIVSNELKNDGRFPKNASFWNDVSDRELSNYPYSLDNIYSIQLGYHDNYWKLANNLEEYIKIFDSRGESTQITTHTTDTYEILDYIFVPESPALRQRTIYIASKGLDRAYSLVINRSQSRVEMDKGEIHKLDGLINSLIDKIESEKDLGSKEELPFSISSYFWEQDEAPESLTNSLISPIFDEYTKEDIDFWWVGKLGFSASIVDEIHSVDHMGDGSELNIFFIDFISTEQLNDNIGLLVDRLKNPLPPAGMYVFKRDSVAIVYAVREIFSIEELENGLEIYRKRLGLEQVYP